MIAKYRTQLRAWLIGTMRDAIRLERAMYDPIQTDRAVYPGRLPAAPVAKQTPKPIDAPIPDPSFEQMQAEAIQAQEKYYEPAK